MNFGFYILLPRLILTGFNAFLVSKPTFSAVSSTSLSRPREVFRIKKLDIKIIS